MMPADTMPGALVVSDQGLVGIHIPEVSVFMPEPGQDCWSHALCRLKALTVLLLDLQEKAGNITTLDASRNQLTSLQETITQHLGSLQDLKLSRNRLQDISGLALLPQLCTLDLARNKLRDLKPLQV